MSAAISNRLSRWTLPFFGCALLNFVIAQALIIAGVTWPEQAWTAPGTLIVVHLLVIGWLSLLMLGALFQFIPVITSKMLPSQHLVLASLVVIELGLAGIVCGFIGLGGGSLLDRCLPAGGALVIVGVLMAIYDLGVPLMRARPLALSGRMVLTALAFLLLTIGLGLSLALALTIPRVAVYLGPLVASGIGYHALAGLGGWFTIGAMGVSYKLLPMFMLAPEERGTAGEVVHYASAAGFGLAVATGLVQAWLPSQTAATLQLVGYALVVIAVAVYLADVVKMYRTRRRAAIELQNKAVVGAFAMLGASIALAAIFLVLDRSAAFAPVVIFLILFGWLSGMGLTQLYKIVPFLTWLGRFGKSLGRGPVPRVQDLVDERRGAPWFIVYFIGIAFAMPALFSHGPGLFRVGMAIAAAATLMLMREYWRAWRGHYARNPAAPAAPPFTNKEISR